MKFPLCGFEHRDHREQKRVERERGRGQAHRGAAMTQRAEPPCPINRELGQKVSRGSAETRGSGNIKPAEELTVLDC